MNRKTSVVVIALSFGQFVLWGTMYNAFTLYIQPWESELGWSPAFIVTAFSLALAVSGLCSIFIGKWIDARGGYVPLVAGSVVAALMFYALSVNVSKAFFVLIWLVLGLAMSATLSQPVYTVFVQMGLDIGRKAILYCSLATALSGTFFLPLVSSLIEAMGWRSSLQILAGLNLLCAVIHAMFVPRTVGANKKEASVTEQTPDVAKSRRKMLALILIGFGANSAVAAILAVYIAPLLLAGHYEMRDIVFAAALAGPVQLLGRVLIISKLGKTVSYYGVGVCGMALQLVSLVALVLSLTIFKSNLLICFFAVLNGLSLGFALISRALITTEFFSTAEYGVIQGYLQTATMLTRAVAPAAFAFIYGLHEQSASLLLMALGLTSLCAIYRLNGKIFSPSSAKPSGLT